MPCGQSFYGYDAGQTDLLEDFEKLAFADGHMELFVFHIRAKGRAGMYGLGICRTSFGDGTDQAGEVDFPSAWDDAAGSGTVHHA